MTDLTVTEQVSTSPMRLWDRLSKTDPKATSRFKRGGGFSGTAVKPIWQVKMMTAVFGPCGLGWGMGKPEYTTQPALSTPLFNDSTPADEWLVFCTVGVWYRDPETQERSELIYGVGGDRYQTARAHKGTPPGIKLDTSDEAYKMAYTDALGNAIKFIGVAADIHMGRFDDSKYVKEMEAEFAGQSDVPKLTNEKRNELEESIKDCISIKELLSRGEIALNVARKAEDDDALEYLGVKMTDQMIDIVGCSSTLDSLKENYEAALVVAQTAGDTATVGLLAKAKNARKAEFTQTANLQSQLKASLQEHQ